MMQTVFFAPSLFLKLVQPSMKSSFFNTNNKVPTEQPFSSSTTLSRMLMDLQLGFNSSSLNVRRNRNPRSYKAFKTKPQEWLLKLKLTFALKQLHFLLYTKKKQSEARRGKYLKIGGKKDDAIPITSVVLTYGLDTKGYKNGQTGGILLMCVHYTQSRVLLWLSHTSITFFTHVHPPAVSPAGILPAPGSPFYTMLYLFVCAV